MVYFVTALVRRPETPSAHPRRAHLDLTINFLCHHSSIHPPAFPLAFLIPPYPRLHNPCILYLFPPCPSCSSSLSYSLRKLKMARPTIPLRNLIFDIHLLATSWNTRGELGAHSNITVSRPSCHTMVALPRSSTLMERSTGRTELHPLIRQQLYLFRLPLSRHSTTVCSARCFSNTPTPAVSRLPIRWLLPKLLGQHVHIGPPPDVWCCGRRISRRRTDHLFASNVR